MLKIMSGGQTGVDRAAWDAAIEVGLPQGGWVPKGRKAEDGKIPKNYLCQETRSARYEERTELNVVESDATLILSFGRPTGGTALTIQLCRRYDRPHLHLDLEAHPPRFAIQQAGVFISERQPKTLNVAGPRGRAGDDVYEKAKDFLTTLLSRFAARPNQNCP